MIVGSNYKLILQILSLFAKNAIIQEIGIIFYLLFYNVLEADYNFY